MLKLKINYCKKVRAAFLLSRTLKHQSLLRKRRKVHLRMIGRHVLARCDAVDFHPWVVLKPAEEFGRDKEVLAAAAAVFAVRGTGDVDQTGVYEAGRLSVRVTGSKGTERTYRSLRGSMPWLISSTSLKGARARLCKAMR
jgi:hypothetical protein